MLVYQRVIKYGNGKSPWMDRWMVAFRPLPWSRNVQKSNQHQKDETSNCTAQSPHCHWQQWFQNVPCPPMFWYILVFLWCSMGNVRVNMGNSTGEILVNEHNRKLLSRDFQPVQPSIISSSPQAKFKVWGFQDSMLGKTPGIPRVGISLHAMPFINPGKVPLVKSTTAVHLCLSSSWPMALAQSWRIPLEGSTNCIIIYGFV